MPIEILKPVLGILSFVHMPPYPKGVRFASSGTPRSLNVPNMPEALSESQHVPSSVPPAAHGASNERHTRITTLAADVREHLTTSMARTGCTIARLLQSSIAGAAWGVFRFLRPTSIAPSESCAWPPRRRLCDTSSSNCDNAKHAKRYYQGAPGRYIFTDSLRTV